MAMLSQLADLVTMSPERELNPLALHPLGVLAKLLLIFALFAGAVAVGPRWRPVLLAALGVGIIGVVSNLR